MLAEHQTQRDPAEEENNAELKAQNDEKAKTYQVELDNLNADLESIITGIDVPLFEASTRDDFTLSSEVEELLRPLIMELKSVTQDPRQIEKLRSDAAHSEDRQRMAQHAIEHIRKLQLKAKEINEDPELLAELEEQRLAWDKHRTDAVNRATVAKHQLDQKLRDRKSLLESSSTLLGSFFRNRGLNLLLAVLAFFGVLGGLRFATRSMIDLAAPKRSRPEAPFYLRLLTVVLHGAIVVFAALAAMMVLYAAGDWILLGLVLLFLVGVAWASKQALPRFFDQTRLMLNLGSVREHERVMYAGLPWRVDTISVFTHLTNPDLTGGHIRLPIRELIGLYSRPIQQKDVWFPCKEGDWVLLGELRGKVLVQTTDVVQLVLLGGSRVTYQTGDFLSQGPNNISAGFRLQVTFGVDYQHQAICTTQISEIMKKDLQREIGKRVGEDNIEKITVEFKEAGASSLDYQILADMKGETAEKYDQLKRLIQRTLVDSCNEQGWVIPFTQLTLHQA